MWNKYVKKPFHTNCYTAWDYENLTCLNLIETKRNILSKLLEKQSKAIETCYFSAIFYILSFQSYIPLFQVTAILVGNGLSMQSSNPAQSCLHLFGIYVLGRSMNPAFLTPPLTVNK